MALKVSEIMNGEPFRVRPEETVDAVLASILTLGITGVPVVDGRGVPLGHVSLRDLIGNKPGTTAGDRMTKPAATVRAEARIEAAARRLAGTRYHRLIVVDTTGRVVGMVSSVDIIRGMLGLPAPHPASFPHLDRASGLSWTDELPLEAQEVRAAPDGPGVIVLLEGGRRRPERVVWAESADRVRNRLREILSTSHPDLLAAWQEHGALRFRAASAPDPVTRAAEVDSILRRVGRPHVPPFFRQPAAG